MNTKIDKTILGYYICRHQIAWRKWDGLIEVTHSVGSPSYDELNALWKDLSEDLTVVSKKEMLDTSFEQLAEWSVSIAA